MQEVLVGQVERGLKSSLQLEIARVGKEFATGKDLSNYVGSPG